VQKFVRSKNRIFTVIILFFVEGYKSHFSNKNELDKAVIVEKRRVVRAEGGGGGGGGAGAP